MQPWRAIWSQIALEHVNERLRVLENEIRTALREDKAFLVPRQRQALIPSLQLYSLLEKRADDWVSSAYEVYCSTWKEQGGHKSRDFCIAVFQLGLLPFIRDKVLNLLCFALATAQPALKINTTVTYSWDSSEFRPGAPLAGVRRIVDSLQNHWSWQVMSVDGNELSASSLAAPQFAPMTLIDPQDLALEAKSAWDRIAHERVRERQRIVFFSVSGLLRGFRGDSHGAYSEQTSRSKHSTSKVPSRELEEAVFNLEDANIQRALEIYEEETPEKKITTATLLWLIHDLGLVPFIEKSVLLDVCFKLDHAQPSLSLNLLRPDNERLFSYNSEKLRKEFPVVIRIVDGLKALWRHKITERAKLMNTQSLGSGDAETQLNDGQQSLKEITEAQDQAMHVQPDPQSKQTDLESQQLASAFPAPAEAAKGAVQSDSRDQSTNISLRSNAKAPSLNYQSPLKRAVCLRLTQKPEATDLEICRWIDEEGACDLPNEWSNEPPDRSFETAYRNPEHRSKIQVIISKVRADMRGAQLL